MLQLEACTATQPGIAGVSFLWFSEHNLPGFTSICQDCLGTCRRYLNLLKASLLKDRGHLSLHAVDAPSLHESKATKALKFEINKDFYLHLRS